VRVDQIAQPVARLGLGDEQRAEVVQMLWPLHGFRQQAGERVVGEQDRAARVRDDHRLAGAADLAAHLLELVVRDQHSHRA
jgi:hypothetical protein